MMLSSIICLDYHKTWLLLFAFSVPNSDVNFFLYLSPTSNWELANAIRFIFCLSNNDRQFSKRLLTI